MNFFSIVFSLPVPSEEGEGERHSAAELPTEVKPPQRPSRFSFPTPWIPWQMETTDTDTSYVLPFFKGTGTLSLSFACLVNYSPEVTHDESSHMVNNTGNFYIDTISRHRTKKAVK